MYRKAEKLTKFRRIRKNLDKKNLTDVENLENLSHIKKIENLKK